MNLKEIAGELRAILSHQAGVVGRMRDMEIDQGHSIIKYGATDPIAFSTKDWHDGVLAKGADGKTIRIVAISAKKPRHGAFRRLLAEISNKGFTPVIVAPMGPVMPGFLIRHNWRMYIAGQGIMMREEWYPPEVVASDD